ncbi:fasciclin domain-containing protein [Flavobacterium sp.]|uniref:fasciclin domain-containing protein n=1 Tax=Flavobacterium sp. TaxID=239 RepID=UPI003751B85E
MKTKTKKLRLFAIIVFLGISLLSCNDDDSQTTTDTTITGIASSNSNLSILVQALTRANLAATLEGTGPFTVFAPTNAAFNTFLTANGYVTNGDPDINTVPVAALTQILKNHVVSGAVQSSGLINNSYIKTLALGSASTSNTLNMYVINTTAGVKLNGISNVITTTAGTTFNIIASNGVIHTVDTVIGLPTIKTLAVANGRFSTLVTLLSGAGLVPTLDGTLGSPFTVFAPDNAAFTTFETQNPGVLSSLTPAQVSSVLTYHVVGGANVLSTGIPTTPIPTLESGTFSVSGTTITDEKTRSIGIIAVDIQASNGVIHVVNNVLLPNSIP